MPGAATASPGRRCWPFRRPKSINCGRHCNLVRKEGPDGLDRRPDHKPDTGDIRWSVKVSVPPLSLLLEQQQFAGLDCSLCYWSWVTGEEGERHEDNAGIRLLTLLRSVSTLLVQPAEHDL